MSRNKHLARSFVPLKLVLLLTTFLSFSAAQAADRKVLVEDFTGDW